MSAARRERLISDKFGGSPEHLIGRNLYLLFLLSFSRAFPLLLHQHIESASIHFQAALSCLQLRQIQRKPVRIVKLERSFSGNSWASFKQLVEKISVVFFRPDLNRVRG